MKKYFLALSFLSIALFSNCHKETTSFYETRFYTNLYYLNPSNLKTWVILENETGEILEVQRVWLLKDSSWHAFKSRTVPSEQTCNITIAVLQQNLPHLSLDTYKGIPSGKNLKSDIFSTGSDYRTTLLKLEITDMPAIETFECVGTSQAAVHIDASGPNLSVFSFSIKTGGTGTLLRWKGVGEQNYHSAWLDLKAYPYLFYLQDTLSASDFTQQFSTSKLYFPYSSNWGATVRGIVNQNKLADFVYLPTNPTIESEDIYDQLDFQIPENLNIMSCWVTAMSVHSIPNLEYERLFELGETPVFAALNFGLKYFHMADNGSVQCDYEGNFDALHISVIGNEGKIGWSVDGSPDDLKHCIMPQFPDSLRQQWPALKGFKIGGSRCGSYGGINGFQEFLDLDRSSSLWRARLGFEGKWQSWE